MSNDLVPKYTNSALAARDIFLAEFQEVLFYFEDANHEAVYERFVAKLFPKLKISNIFCLGGKSEILKKIKENSQKGKARVFIVDKDFDDLLKKLSVHDELYYLTRYSLENYLLNWDAIKEIAIEEFEGAKRLAEINQLTEDFEQFWGRIFEQVEKLTRLFIVARRYDVAIATTKVEYQTYLEKEEGKYELIPSDDLIREYKNSVQKNCNLATNEWLTDNDSLQHELSRAFDKLDNHQVILAQEKSDHFCGKHLLGFMLHYADTKLGSKLLGISKKKIYLKLLNYLREDDLAKIRAPILKNNPFLVGK
jgi:hypothetical protein